MARRRQQSKRDRGRLHEGLPPKLEPKYGYCPDCGEAIHNEGAHAEACPGLWKQPKRCQARAPGYGHGVWRYCVRPWNHEGGHIYQ